MADPELISWLFWADQNEIIADKICGKPHKKKKKKKKRGREREKNWL